VETISLECPYCHTRGALKVKWTRDKSGELRRYTFECVACGEPVTGWLQLDKPTTACKPPFPSTTPLFTS
jgi:hypothetical protein